MMFSAVKGHSIIGLALWTTSGIVGFSLLLDLVKNASVVTQFIQIVSFFTGAIFVVFLCGKNK